MTIANLFVGLVSLLHAGFMILEMFFWGKPLGPLKIGPDEPAIAATSKILAANQGLYNGFLAAGLAWGLSISGAHGTSIKVFFLSCVIVAGVFGGLTDKREILLVQALPGVVALALVLWSRG